MSTLSKMVNSAVSALTQELTADAGSLSCVIPTSENVPFGTSFARQVFASIYTLNAARNQASNLEVVAITARTVVGADTTFTITRAQCGTTRVYHPIGSVIACTYVAEYHEELAAALKAIEDGTTLGPTAINGNLTVGSAVNSSRYVYIDGNAGYYRGVRFQTAGVIRWQWSEGSAAESGADAGSNAYFGAYSDNGVWIDNPIGIMRATGGTMTLSRPVYATGEVSAGSFVDRSDGFNKAGALAIVEKIKNNADGTIKHDSLPDFVRVATKKPIYAPVFDETNAIVGEVFVGVELEEGRSIDRMLSVAVAALQEQVDLNKDLIKRIEDLEKKLK
jgi:hypothetical protein